MCGSACPELLVCQLPTPGSLWAPGPSLPTKPPSWPPEGAGNHTASLAPGTNESWLWDCFHQEASPVLSDPFPGPLPSSRGQHISQASSPPFEAGVPVLAPLAQREKPSRIFANPTPQTPVQPNPPAFVPLKEQNPLCGLITPKGTVQGCTCVP